jgi:hypothetical protein
MIDGFPDDVLLDTFHFCVPPRPPGSLWVFSLPSRARSWVTLTQVCRRWRYIVLGSPRHLNLQVVCTPTTRTRTLLDIWPPFPISVYSDSLGLRVEEKSLENLTVAVKHHDRISEIYIETINGPVLERLIDAMQEPLPALTHFLLGSTDQSVPVLPETFLGGSAPLLRSFDLRGIPFPTFPKFILSATNIIYLVRILGASQLT